jgi:hypothetical protein
MPASRLNSIAEQFPIAPAAIFLPRVGLIRQSCSLRAYRLELGLLLLAQRSIEIVKCQAHGLDCLQHVVEPFADGRKPCRWRDRIVGLARGLEHVRRLGACVLERTH